MIRDCRLSIVFQQVPKFEAIAHGIGDRESGIVTSRDFERVLRRQVSETPFYRNAKSVARSRRDISGVERRFKIVRNKTFRAEKRRFSPNSYACLCRKRRPRETKKRSYFRPERTRPTTQRSWTCGRIYLK